MTSIRAAVLAAFVLTHFSAAQDAVFRTVFTNLTAPATGANLPNSGQALHLVVVQFPTAVADVTAGLTVRLEGSYNNTQWFPISRDITSATYLAGSGAVAIERANAAWPYVRVRATAVPNTPGANVYYTGSSYPIGNVQVGARTTTNAGLYDKASWGICTTGSCAVASDITVRYISIANLTVDRCYAAAKTGPVGAALTIDIGNNGTSIFGGGAKLTIASGATSGYIATFANPAIAEGDQLTIGITTIGSTTPGANVSVTCRLAIR